MVKERVRIPAKTHDQVLKEFNHRCARCGADRPQLHHIDEDPANNDPLNLIPLCPNCHLTDQHNPTRNIEPGRLRLFRQYKDPTILTPQFHALFRRMRFLETIDLDCSDDEMTDRAARLNQEAMELYRFVKALEMGTFYADQLDQLFAPPGCFAWHAMKEANLKRSYSDTLRRYPTRYCKHLLEVRNEVYDLVIELCRFQQWNVNP